MITTIKKNLLRRLTFCALILATVFGLIITIIELERTDQNVVNLAAKESSTYFPLLMDYYRDSSRESLDRVRISALKDLQKGHFVLVEFYDHDKKKLFEESLGLPQEVEHAIEKKKHTFLLGDQIEYMRIFTGSSLFLKIVVPVINTDSKNIIGYFEGVYQVTGEEIRDIINGILLSVAQVILVVLLTSFILYPIIVLLNKKLLGLTDDLARANVGILNVLGSAVAKRDSDTSLHNYRVVIYAVRLAEECNLNHEQIANLIRGAFLHDVGKIGISDTILLKPGKLTPEEFEVMKSHVIHGVDIIKKYRWLRDAEDVVLYHHEKYDGSGYMAGISGDDIPINARIFTIVDVFDALTSRRPYKKPLLLEDSLEMLKKDSGHHFDPNLLERFLPIIGPLYAQIMHMDNEYALEQELESIIQNYITR